MNHETTIKRIQSLVPSVMALEFGCMIEKVFWYKSEADKKKGNIDWLQSSEHGNDGVIIKDLRSDFLPMSVDSGDQLEFEIQHNDIVSFEIIGKPITIAVVLLAIDINSTDSRWKIIVGCNFMRIQFGESYALWNLSKDNFNDQSEETKTFIGELITNNI